MFVAILWVLEQSAFLDKIVLQVAMWIMVKSQLYSKIYSCANNKWKLKINEKWWLAEYVAHFFRFKYGGGGDGEEQLYTARSEVQRKILGSLKYPLGIIQILRNQYFDLLRLDPLSK